MSHSARLFFALLFIALSAVKSSAQQYQPVITFSDAESGITVMTKDPSLKYLIAGDEKGNLYFRDIVSAELIKKINAHGAPIRQLQFNSTGNLLISATNDGEIKIFDFNKDKIVQSIFSPRYAGINFVLFSIADGFIYFNGHNTLYKTRSDLTQSVVPLVTEKDTIFDAVITSDRNSLIYATGNTLKIINTRSDIPRQEFSSGSSKIKRIALVKDTLLATWSEDGTIMFWHYNLGQIDGQPRFFLKAGKPTAMNFSPDGMFMCTGEIGNWARIWKPMERIIMQELFSHSASVTSSIFGLSKDVVYTGSLDKSIIQWRIGEPVTKPAESVVLVPAEPVKPQPEIPKPPVIVNHDVVMTAGNIPEYITGRKVLSTMKVEINQPSLSVYVYDNSYVDGDTMSLFFNGVWILDH